MNEATPMKGMLRSATERAVESDLDRHVGTGTRMLEQRYRSLQEAMHAYALNRARIVADAERELTTFRGRVRSHLAQVDHEHHERVERIERDIARLELMQEASR